MLEGHTQDYCDGFNFTLRQLHDHGHELAKETLAHGRERALEVKGTQWVEGATRALDHGTLGNPNHVWTNMRCPAYRTLRGADCNCIDTF